MNRKKIIFIVLLLQVAVFLLDSKAAIAQSSASKRTRVGNPKITDACWPTTGIVSQGPQGATSHANIAKGSGGYAIDIAASAGTPIYSTFDGTAKVFDCTGKGVCDNGYGNLVKIIPDAFPNGIVYHAHLLTILVTDGQRVRRGEEIGLMGSTGHAYGTHLHYEFRGIDLAPPNIPEPISPPSCDPNCTPSQISVDSCAKHSILQKTGSLNIFSLNKLYGT